MAKSHSDVYTSMFIGVALFVGGMVTLLLLKKYFDGTLSLPFAGNKPLGTQVIPVVSDESVEIPQDPDISESIKKQHSVGSMFTRNYNITSTVTTLWSDKDKGLHWTVVDFVNNGPDPVYISVNTSDWPDAGLSVGQALHVDLKQRNAIDKIYMRCDQGKTANVSLWVVK